VDRAVNRFRRALRGKASARRAPIHDDLARASAFERYAVGEATARRARGVARAGGPAVGSGLAHAEEF
jgi:hypothetical protein